MIFCGDIALPDASIQIDIAEALRKKNWFVNLEGSLIEASQANEMRLKNRVFNNLDSIKRLSEVLNIKVCSLANNHIEDCSTVAHSIGNLESIGIKYVGADSNLSDAEKNIHIAEEELTVMSFGWEVIKCPIASRTRSGVNPHKKSHVIETVRKALLDNKKVICFFHWGYELEAYPLPYDRELAHTLIDLGVYAIIGCHAHRVQQIEFYKGKPIVYGLGNFLFPHGVYWNGRLKFPEFTKKELAFEIKPDGQFVAHWFEYDIANKKLSFAKSASVSAGMTHFDGRAEYEDYSPEEYDSFFKKNRYHKKLIPVFKSNESWISYEAKSVFVKIRGRLIDLLVKLNLKAKK